MNRPASCEVQTVRVFAVFIVAVCLHGCAQDSGIERSLTDCLTWQSSESPVIGGNAFSAARSLRYSGSCPEQTFAISAQAIAHTTDPAIGGIQVRGMAADGKHPKALCIAYVMDGLELIVQRYWLKSSQWRMDGRTISVFGRARLGYVAPEDIQNAPWLGSEDRETAEMPTEPWDPHMPRYADIACPAELVVLIPPDRPVAAGLCFGEYHYSNFIPLELRVIEESPTVDRE